MRPALRPTASTSWLSARTRSYFAYSIALIGTARGIVPRVPRLLGREAQRVAQHFGQVVPHEQRFVFVDGQARVLFVRRELEPDAALRDAVPGDEPAS